MGISYSSSMKRKQVCTSDKELLRRNRELQGKMMFEREKQRQAYERKVQEREAVWLKERRVLEEQVRKLRHFEVATARKVFTAEEPELIKLGVSERQKDYTAERWKKLYNVIKAELDDLIQRTQNSGLFMYDLNKLQYLERELQCKENTIAALKDKIIAMEKEESKKAREADILRQSLRIIMNSSKMSKSAQVMRTTRSLSRLQDRIYHRDSKSTNTNTYDSLQKVK